MYLLKQTETGDFMVGEVEMTKMVSIADFKPRIVFNEGTFTHHGKEARFKSIVQGTTLYHIMCLPLMQWSSILKYSEDDKAWIHGGNAENPVTLFLENVMVMFTCTKEEVTPSIVRLNGRIPKLNNVWSDGRICTKIIPPANHDNLQMSPYMLLRMLETPKGNNDLTESSFKYDVMMIDGIPVCIGMQEQGSVAGVMKELFNFAL